MITPAGKECRFYYQDYFRGRSEQECRLIKSNPRSPAWQPKDCGNCPVPEILQANSSPDLVLEATVKPGFLGVNRRVEVKAFCSRHLIDVTKPEVGCPRCAAERPGLAELKRWQAELTEKVNVPVTYLDELYNFRMHIEYALNRLRRKKEVLQTGEREPSAR